MKSVLAVVTSLVALSTAGPLQLSKRAITPQRLNEFKLAAQYAGAAYCDPNNDGTLGKVSCGAAGSCPLVDAANVVTTNEYRNTPLDTTGYVAVDSTNRKVVAAFRGTASPAGWLANLNYQSVGTDLCSGCTLHHGFYKAFGEVRNRVIPAIRSALAANPGYGVVITGHSLGGALATLTAAEYRKSGDLAAVYTFGAPRVGNDKFAQFVGIQAGGNFRITNGNDPVPRLPQVQMGMGYAHVGPEFFINSADNYVSESEVTELPSSRWAEGNQRAPGGDIDRHKNYFGPIAACAPNFVFG